MTAENGTAAGASAGPSFSAANAAAAAKPLMDATHTVYEKVAGRVESYFEHWVDLVEEIKIEQQVDAQAAPGVADIIASLPEAEVASEIPGRARLRLAALRGESGLAEQCAAALGSLPGVSRVQVRSLTGSILIFFDTREYSSLQELLSVLSS